MVSVNFCKVFSSRKSINRATKMGKPKLAICEIRSSVKGKPSHFSFGDEFLADNVGKILTAMIAKVKGATQHGLSGGIEHFASVENVFDAITGFTFFIARVLEGHEFKSVHRRHWTEMSKSVVWTVRSMISAETLEWSSRPFL